jgi:TPR repeat protein
MLYKNHPIGTPSLFHRSSVPLLPPIVQPSRLAMADLVMLHTCLDLSYTGSTRTQYSLDLTGANLCISCASALHIATDPRKGVYLISRTTGEQKWIEPASKIRSQGVHDGDTIVYMVPDETTGPAPVAHSSSAPPAPQSPPPARGPSAPQIVRHDAFTRIKGIGNGAFGVVYSARENGTNRLVAIKILTMRTTDPAFAQNFLREVEILAAYAHPAILEFIGYVPHDPATEQEPAIITELMEGGSLDDHITKERQGAATPVSNATRKLIIMYGIAAAMAHLHANRVLHRDLKPANVFLTRDLEPKVADFGTSKVTQPGATSLQSVTCGTPWFMAPEIFAGGDSSYPADVYAFGMLVYILLTGRKPFNEENLFAIARKVEKGDRPPIPPSVPSHYRALIAACWDNRPSARPTFPEIAQQLSSPLFLTPDVDFAVFTRYQGILFPNLAGGARPPPAARPPPPRKSRLQQLMDDAANGDSDCQVELGLLYVTGEGVSVDLARAAHWLERAANANNTRGMCGLAQLLRKNGRAAEAAEWFAKASDNGDVASTFEIARMCEHGEGTRNAESLSLKFYRLAAERGHSGAIARLGRAYEQGELGVARSRELALSLYRTASERGDPGAMYRYGKALQYERGVRRNAAEAVRLFRLAAERRYAPARARLGMMAVAGDAPGVQCDPTLGKVMINAAIAQGYGKAHRYLGRIADQGIRCPANKALAFAHYRHAAEAGHGGSSRRIAQMLIHAVGCQPSPSAAAIILRDLIQKRGSVQAMVEYGLLCLRGEGVEKDVELAKRLWLQAANAGSTRARQYLAQLQSEQRDMRRGDVEQAARIFNRIFQGFL